MAGFLALSLVAFWAAVAVHGALRNDSPDLWLATLAVAVTGAVLPPVMVLAAQGGRAHARRAAGIVALSGLAALALAVVLARGETRARLAEPAEGLADQLGTAMAAGIAGADVMLKLGGGGAVVAVVFGAVWLVLRLWRG